MNELNPKFEVGQAVDAELNGLVGHKPATIVARRNVWIYDVQFDGFAAAHPRNESQIRQPRPSPEEAWEKATMLIGKRSHERYEYCCMNGQEVEAFHRETRHQVYQILGSAQIKIEPEVKTDVRRLIGIADNM